MDGTNDSTLASRSEFRSRLASRLVADLSSNGPSVTLVARSTHQLFRVISEIRPEMVSQISVIDRNRQMRLAASVDGITGQIPEAIALGSRLATRTEYQRRLIVGSGFDAQVLSRAFPGRLLIEDMVALKSVLEVEPDFPLQYLDYLLVDGHTLLASGAIAAEVPGDEWFLLPPDQFDEFERLWAGLLDVVRRPVGVQTPEPLWRSVELMSAFSHIVCEGSYINRAGCAWYHGAWPYLRLADKVSTPSWHDTFFSDSIKSAFHGSRDLRILISGTADYSMLAHTLAPLMEGGVLPEAVEIYVLDQCRSPLMISEWYCKQYGVPTSQVHFVTADILTLDGFESVGSDRPFDLILSDAFLTRFRDLDADSVLRKWRDLLSPDGHVVTTVRISTGSVGHDREQLIESFTAVTMSRLAAWQPYIAIPEPHLRDLVEGYARTIRSEDAGSADAIVSDFAAADLHVVSAEHAWVPGEFEPTEYLRVRAGREEPTALSRTSVPTRADVSAPQSPMPIPFRFLGEAIPLLAGALRAQTARDHSWSANLGGAVFASHAHAALGDLDTWSEIRDWIYRCWAISDDSLPKPIGKPTQDSADFPEIVKRMKSAGDSRPPDAVRFHRTWVLGMLLTFESDAADGDSERAQTLVSAARSVQADDGWFYPRQVPWVTGRALIGLSRIARRHAIDCSDVIAKAQNWLLGSANLGWDPGTAGWNSFDSTTALVVTALLLSGVDRNAGAIEDALDLVLLQHPEKWTARENVQVCAEVLFALLLAGRSLDGFTTSQMDLLSWSRRSAAEVVTAVVAIARGEESPRVPYVLSLLIDLLLTDGRFTTFAELGVGRHPGDPARNEIDLALRGLLSEATEWMDTLQQQQRERQADLRRLPESSLAALRKAYDVRKEVVSELESTIGELRTELNAPSPEPQTIHFGAVLNRLQKKVKDAG